MKGRWIKTYESLLDWEFFFDPLILRAWIYLLFKANHKDVVWKGVEVKRGELVTSLSTLSRDLRMSVMQVRRVLATIKSASQITIKSTNKYRIITICEYEKYQQCAGDNQQASKQPNRQSNQQHLKNNKEDKEIISTNVDNIPPISPPGLKPPGLKDKPPKEKKFSFVVAPEFEAAFSAWLEYKHQRRQSYKSDMSLKSCYNKLLKLSGNDPEIAMAIVEQSMANNWACLFPLKPDYNATTKTNQPGNDPRQQERANLAAGVAATIARRFAEDDARAEALRKP